MITRQTPTKLENIAVLGLGRAGLAAARLALDAGLSVVCFDDQMSSCESLPETCFVPPQGWDWAQLDALVISPGIPHEFPFPHPVAEQARKAGLPLICDIELAIRLQSPSRWIAITGTNGKSTTTALIAHILKEAGIVAVAGGNLGPAVASLNAPGKDGVRVIEISSYQLELTPSLRPDIAVILNLSADHLDRHGGWDGYLAAKRQILAGLAVNGLAILGPGPALDEMAATLSKRADAPALTRLADSYTDADIADNPALPGGHNAQNCAAARAACARLGLTSEQIEAGIASFAGLPHRLQPAGQAGPVRLVNDSKATNAAAAATALQSFEQIYWCAGGQAKQDGLADCLPHLDRVVQGYLYGAAAQDFAAQLAGRLATECFASMDEAVRAAFRAALQASGEPVVLLSPAAASFDQFDNFEARGAAFMKLAASLCQPAGDRP
jgi:UDP-N-acetylmuramoylalanine--D-glutamate ligase